jgi:hypothetical protein
MNGKDKTVPWPNTSFDKLRMNGNGRLRTNGKDKAVPWPNTSFDKLRMNGGVLKRDKSDVITAVP